VSKAGSILTDSVKKYFEHYAFHACRQTNWILRHYSSPLNSSYIKDFYNSILKFNINLPSFAKPLYSVKKYFEHYAFHACRQTKFALAQLGNDAGIYGSACSILGR